MLPDDSPVLVVVVNDPADLARARNEGWYRIPMNRAPKRVAAEWLAFYQTGAFPEGERWAVHWLAPVRGYRIASRRDLLPEESDHPRADHVYYQVKLGALVPLDRPVPSRRLRRITFIPTTLARLAEAEEINDLWIKSTTQERLWAALKQAGVEAEREYPLEEEDAEAPDVAVEGPRRFADFAVFGPAGRAALIVLDEPGDGDEAGGVREAVPREYVLARAGWRALAATRAELDVDPERWAERLIALANG